MRLLPTLETTDTLILRVEQQWGHFAFRPCLKNILTLSDFVMDEEIVGFFLRD